MNVQKVRTALILYKMNAQKQGCYFPKCISCLFSACLQRVEDYWNNREGPIQLFLADFRINNQRIRIEFRNLQELNTYIIMWMYKNAIVHWLLPVELVVLIMVSDIEQCTHSQYNATVKMRFLYHRHSVYTSCKFIYQFYQLHQFKY